MSINLARYRHSLRSYYRWSISAASCANIGLMLCVFCAPLVAACGSGSGSNSTSPSSFTLGGSISNLTVQGLVLSNGTDTVAVPANASSIAFPTPISSGTSYTVSIVRQPPGFTDICALGNATGTMSNANILNVTVSCHSASAVVTTLAGSGNAGNADGTGTAASFNFPNGVAVDTQGNVYVGDSGNNLIRKITASGVVTTLAGSGNRITTSITPCGPVATTGAGSGSAGNTNGTGATASFNSPYGITVDIDGNVYVGDLGNHMIRKISSAGAVTTLAGSGSAGSTDGTGTAASFCGPEGVAVDTAGNVYVADSYNNLIRKITKTGGVTTLAGSGSFGAGNANGTGTAASFSFPTGVAVDLSGNIYVADANNLLIRMMTSAGVVTTFAGSGRLGRTNGTGTAASFGLPIGLAVDTAGNIYVADATNNLIRKITAAGAVTTLAGSGSAGNANGTGTAASFSFPSSVAVDTAGNVYVGDSNNSLIRKISPQ